MGKELVLISHGNFCVELKKSVEMIMGPQESIKTVPLLEEEGKEEYKEKLISIIDKSKQTIILTDLKGGTPGNIAAELLLNTYTFDLYAGMNMPMVIDFINSEMIDSEMDIVTSGKDSILYMNDLLNI